MAEKVNIKNVVIGASVTFLVWKILDYTIAPRLDRIATRYNSTRANPNGAGPSHASGSPMLRDFYAGAGQMDIAAASAIAREAQAILKASPNLEPWDLHKISRVRQRLADIAWFLAERPPIQNGDQVPSVLARNLQQILEDATWIASQQPPFVEWVSDYLSTSYTDIHEIYENTVRM